MPEMNLSGKPNAGNPHVRFDEEGEGSLMTTSPLLYCLCGFLYLFKWIPAFAMFGTSGIDTKNLPLPALKKAPTPANRSFASIRVPSLGTHAALPHTGEGKNKQLDS